MTKIEIQQINTKLAAENAALRAELSKLRTQCEAADLAAHRRANEEQSASKPMRGAYEYPLKDWRGRAYRMDGRVKCYPAS